MDLINRTPAGVPTGGQFAATSHSEPQLSLAPAVEPAPEAPDFDPEFEAAYGAALTNQLLKMPKSPIKDTLGASRLADYIRESHPDYMADGTAVHPRKDAFEMLEGELPYLDDDRRKHYAGLIRFAVHNEMKHYSNTEHVLSPDNDYELIIEKADYDSEDDFAYRGQDENREQWERLANTACLAAINENIHAQHRLREAA
ncbi:hypothetical protein ACX80N_12485 [Arthrobacter sp. MDT2-16]